MKKITALALAILLCFTFLITGCTKKRSNSGKQFVVVTSFYPIYLFTLNIAENINGVDVINMTAPQTGCLHDYQLTARDVKTLSGASVFVINGAGMESFLGNLSQQIPRLKTIEAAKGIELMKDPLDPQTDNAHVWVSITNAISEVKNIANGLEAADPQHAAQYNKNATSYIKKLELEKAKMHNALKYITKRDIITFHEAFPYFAKEFDLNIPAVIETDPGMEPSAAQIKNVVATVKEKKIKALFVEPQYSPKSAQTVSNETGAKIYSLDPVVTGPMNEPDYYVKAMDKNLEILKQALK